MKQTNGNPESEETNVEKSCCGKDSSLPENIIKRLNRKFPGGFDDSALTLINILYQKTTGRRGLRSMAKTSSLRAFRGAFPRFFGEAAQECHDEFPEKYSAIFGNKGKYYETMLIMADTAYMEFTKNR